MVKPIGVKVLNQYIKRELSVDPILRNLYVLGEVTNLRDNRYLYFDLKEDDELINCVSFTKNEFNIQNGDKILVSGSLTTYANASRYQIHVKNIEKIGEGDSFVQLNKLKEKLFALGYFDQIRKKQIPDFPINIGLITSDKSAAIRDFLSILENNYPIANISLYSTRVQGNLAANDIIKAIRFLDSKNLDLIVLTRGGGSNEDLSIFNDEMIAHELFKAQTPIISAIGHEIDFTISDLVCDLRVSTPTKAAEFIVEKFVNSKSTIENLNLFNKQIILEKVNRVLNIVEYYHLSNEKHSPINILQNRILLLNNINSNNNSSIKNFLFKQERRLNELNSDIERSFAKLLDLNLMKVKDLDDNFVDIENLKIGNKYYLFNDNVRYKIEILERDDDR